MKKFAHSKNHESQLGEPNEFGLHFAPTRHVHTVAFRSVATAPLMLDAVYSGGASKNVGDDPLARMFPGAGNQGGFRPIGGRRLGKCRALLIYTSGKETDWPDQMDLQRGTLTYYGDNRHPGRDLHDTKRGGNLLLREMFDALRGPLPLRRLIPPIFVFARTAPGWAVKFRGLAVPGEAGVSPTESLVAIWRMSGDNRFQNYRATFTILDTRPLIDRMWVDSLCSGTTSAVPTHAPKPWLDWIERGVTRPLQVRPLIEPRTRDEQLPEAVDRRGWEMLDCLHRSIGDRAFEFVAVAIFKLAEPNMSAEVTRSAVDGGRDAVGQLSLGGIIGGAHLVEFALEAKHFNPRSSAGVTVGHTKRLIARLRHRQFGVLVTTAHVSRQAYSEIISDQHPIVVIAGRDIVRLLRSKGIHDSGAVRDWVERVMATVPSDD